MYSSIVEAIFAHARRNPDKLCLADDGGRATYSEYAEIICRYAALFEGLGLSRGERAVVEAQQTIDFLAVQAALQLLGAIFVPVERGCAPEKLRALAERAGARLTVARQAGGGEGLFFTHEQLRARMQSSRPRPVGAFPSGDTICEILFSTGTSGREKGVALTHANNVALAENVIFGVGMEADNVEMIPSPLNHSHGLRRYYANMYRGGSAILLGSALDVKRFMENMDAYRVNAIDLVPSALRVVLRLTGDALAAYRAQLRYIQFGAAPMAEDDRARICALLPGVPLYNIYGSTESGCSCIYDFNRPGAKKSCIGRATRNAELFLVDNEGRELEPAPQREGLLACRGGMNMACYWGDEAGTRETLRAGAVYTRDLARFDGDGELILLGRADDVINVGGKKVAPEEIEDAARRIPEIADCGALPYEDPLRGPVPLLFVQMKGGARFDPVHIRAQLAQMLEPFKLPARIEHLPSIPRSFNGKLLRRELAEHIGGRS